MTQLPASRKAADRCGFPPKGGFLSHRLTRFPPLSQLFPGLAVSSTHQHTLSLESCFLWCQSQTSAAEIWPPRVPEEPIYRCPLLAQLHLPILLLPLPPEHTPDCSYPSWLCFCRSRLRHPASPVLCPRLCSLEAPQHKLLTSCGGLQERRNGGGGEVK